MPGANDHGSTALEVQVESEARTIANVARVDLSTFQRGRDDRTGLKWAVTQNDMGSTCWKELHIAWQNSNQILGPGRCSPARPIGPRQPSAIFLPL